MNEVLINVVVNRDVKKDEVIPVSLRDIQMGCRVIENKNEWEVNEDERRKRLMKEWDEIFAQKKEEEEELAKYKEEKMKVLEENELLKKKMMEDMQKEVEEMLLQEEEQTMEAKRKKAEQEWEDP